MPSGWTPIELLSHVLHMERRWFVWGFLGEDVADAVGRLDRRRPVGGRRRDPSVRWQVADDVTAEELAARLAEVGGAHPRRCCGTSRWRPPAPPAARFPDDPPTLRVDLPARACTEYARHAGHLDIVVELGTA